VFCLIYSRFCLTPSGGDVEVEAVAAEGEKTPGETSTSSGKNCHFHAGIEYVSAFPECLILDLACP
jgi:hypothetical protein